MRLRLTDRCRIWMPAERREFMLPLEMLPGRKRGVVQLAGRSRTVEVLILSGRAHQHLASSAEAHCRTPSKPMPCLVPSANPANCSVFCDMAWPWPSKWQRDPGRGDATDYVCARYMAGSRLLCSQQWNNGATVARVLRPVRILVSVAKRAPHTPYLT